VEDAVSTKLSLLVWLEERRQNALRIAMTKRGEDRQGWLEDASYLSQSVEAVRQLIKASGDEHINVPIRSYIALKILRAWNHGTAGFETEVIRVINGWFDSGMKGPIPWPDSPFFSEWAQQVGLSKVGQYVGYKFDAALLEGK
jgi:hypothetical protein